MWWERFRHRSTNGEQVMEFGDVMIVVVCNTSFKKRNGRLIMYELGGIKRQIDFFLVRKADRKLVKDLKEYLCGVIVHVSGQRKVLCAKEEVWKLKEPAVKQTFYAEM